MPRFPSPTPMTNEFAEPDEGAAPPPAAAAPPPPPRPMPRPKPKAKKRGKKGRAAPREQFDPIAKEYV